mmetsp:Transcript_20902/g.52826  ORF Transcript_20902/g.52826 Transcript_20902/m.52826 type:complete len:252 (+) Transcript_20902:69-824(+)
MARTSFQRLDKGFRAEAAASGRQHGVHGYDTWQPAAEQRAAPRLRQSGRHPCDSVPRRSTLAAFRRPQTLQTGRTGAHRATGWQCDRRPRHFAGGGEYQPALEVQEGAHELPGAGHDAVVWGPLLQARALEPEAGGEHARGEDRARDFAGQLPGHRLRRHFGRAVQRGDRAAGGQVLRRAGGSGEKHRANLLQKGERGQPDRAGGAVRVGRRIQRRRVRKRRGDDGGEKRSGRRQRDKQPRGAARRRRQRS